MDHIPLEMHMGLEMKGELPDNMHCSSLSTKFWIMGWVLGQILKAMGLSCGYLHKPCGSWGSLALTVVLHVKAMAPVPSAHHAHDCAVTREVSFGRMKGMGCGGGWYCWILPSVFLLCFSPFSPSFSLYFFHLSLPPYFVVSFPFIPTLFKQENERKTACI